MQTMKLLPLFGLLLTAQARFIDESVLSEGDIVLRNLPQINPNDNEVAAGIVINALSKHKQGLKDVILVEKQHTPREEKRDNELSPKKIDLQQDTVKNNDSEKQHDLARLSESSNLQIETTTQPITNMETENSSPKSTPASSPIISLVNATDSSSSNTEITQSLIKPELVTSEVSEPNTNEYISTTITNLPTGNLQKLQVAQQATQSVSPTQPFAFDKAISSMFPTSVEKLAESENVVGLGLVLLPNPFYNKKTATSSNELTETTSSNTYNSAQAKLQFNPVYFYLDSNHMQQALSQYTTGKIDSDVKWMPFASPPSLQVKTENAKLKQPQEQQQQQQAQLDKVGVSNEATMHMTGNNMNDVDLLGEYATNEKSTQQSSSSVIFEMEIPQPIYKLFKSFISIFSR